MTSGERNEFARVYNFKILREIYFHFGKSGPYGRYAEIIICTNSLKGEKSRYLVESGGGIRTFRNKNRVFYSVRTSRVLTER